MVDTLIFPVPQGVEKERIDKIITLSCEGFSRAMAQKLIEDGAVCVNGRDIAKNHRVSAGDVIRILIRPPKALEVIAQDIPLDIRYEDSDLLVVNKPRGMVVHPAAGNADGTLVNALLNHCGDSLSGINGVIRPGIVHRIDKDTSGLLIVAKNDLAHISLAKQIKAHSFKREYRAVVHGTFKKLSGIIDLPIGRSSADRKKMAVTLKNSRSAITHYEVIESFKAFSYIKLVLETGRTHQIRVHMANSGHAVAGDKVYGPKNTPSKLNGQCLHACCVGFIHPRSGEYIELETELPDYFENFLNEIKKN